jgi:hypothetical protein
MCLYNLFLELDNELSRGSVEKKYETHLFGPWWKASLELPKFRDSVCEVLSFYFIAVKEWIELSWLGIVTSDGLVNTVMNIWLGYLLTG